MAKQMISVDWSTLCFIPLTMSWFRMVKGSSIINKFLLTIITIIHPYQPIFNQYQCLSAVCHPLSAIPGQSRPLSPIFDIISHYYPLSYYLLRFAIIIMPLLTIVSSCKCHTRTSFSGHSVLFRSPPLGMNHNGCINYPISSYIIMPLTHKGISYLSH